MNAYPITSLVLAAGGALLTQPALLLLALMALYGAVFDYLGYAIATVLFLVAAFIVLASELPEEPEA